MIASHLLKACHYWSDQGEGQFELFYIRTKEKHEIDFLITKKHIPWLSLECKLNETSINKNHYPIISKLDCPHIQIIHEPNYHKIIKKNILITSAQNVLNYLP